MKTNKLRHYLLFFVVCSFAFSFSQTVFVGANESLSLNNGTIFHVDGLTLTPSTDFEISNNEISYFQRVGTLLPNVGIKRTYELDSNINSYSGDIEIKFNDADLNGESKADLNMIFLENNKWLPEHPTNKDVTNNRYSVTVANKTFKEVTLSSFKPTPTINFPDIIKTMGDPDFALAISSNNTSTFNFSISDPTKAQITGNTVTLLSAGTAIITATQPANNYYSAGTATMTLTINPAPLPTITFPDITKTMGDSDFELAISSNNTSTFSFSISDPTKAQITGNTVTLLSAGMAIVTATQPANDYYSAGTATMTLTINSAPLPPPPPPSTGGPNDDDDNDGYTNSAETTCGSDPDSVASTPLDTDLDGIPDCIDTDDDNDGYPDDEDEFPKNASDWIDTDGDGTGNNEDTDDDNDMQTDADEIACGSDPLDAQDMAPDTDEDGIIDCLDLDDDNDGVNDDSDHFPNDPSDWVDTDEDGTGNNEDPDDDNDSQSDYNELLCGSDPLDASSIAEDMDGDSIPDCADSDRDGDGVENDNDSFPDNGEEWEDIDNDGIGDNIDTDFDNDGCNNSIDAFPLDPTECYDSDNDGIGDNADLDIDNDGYEDDKLFVSGLVIPGSSGSEDTWKVINIERFPNASISIYNQNKQEVFSSKNYKNDWRGTFKDSGDFLPSSSYYYIIDPNNGDELISGWLYLTY